MLYNTLTKAPSLASPHTALGGQSLGVHAPLHSLWRSPAVWL